MAGEPHHIVHRKSIGPYIGDKRKRAVFSQPQEIGDLRLRSGERINRLVRHHCGCAEFLCGPRHRNCFALRASNGCGDGSNAVHAFDCGLVNRQDFSGRQRVKLACIASRDDVVNAGPGHTGVGLGGDVETDLSIGVICRNGNAGDAVQRLANIKCRH